MMALSGGCSMCFTDQQLITESLSSSHSGSETCRRETTRPTNQKSHSLRVASLQPQNMNKTITHDRAHTLWSMIVISCPWIRARELVCYGDDVNVWDEQIVSACSIRSQLSVSVNGANLDLHKTTWGTESSLFYKTFSSRFLHVSYMSLLRSLLVLLCRTPGGGSLSWLHHWHASAGVPALLSHIFGRCLKTATGNVCLPHPVLGRLDVQGMLAENQTTRDKRQEAPVVLRSLSERCRSHKSESCADGRLLCLLDAACSVSWL